MQNQNVIVAGVIAAAIVIVGFFAYSVGSMAVKNAAVDGCAKVAMSIKQGDYIQPVYKTCMTDKGFK